MASALLSILAILISILLILAVLIIGLVLFIPFHIHARFQADDTNFTAMRIKWLFGAISAIYIYPLKETDVSIFGRVIATKKDSPKSKETPQAEEKKKAKQGKKKEGKKKSKIATFPKSCTAFLLKVSLRLIKALQVRLDIRGDIGLEDPADTGFLSACIWPFLGMLPPGWIDLSFDYERETLGGHADLRARMWLIQLLAIIFTALLLNRKGRTILVWSFRR